MDPELERLSLQLADTAIRNTARLIADRITAVKARKQDKETIAELESIVNDLIADKAEIHRIAQAYQDELVAQRISDDDVTYITTSILPVIKKLAESGVAGPAAQTEEMMRVLEPILSAETVKVMQLLGFNFRKAIGQPLTELVSRAIMSKAAPASDSGEMATLQLRREITYAEIVKDPEAYRRLAEFSGRA